ncbi:MAG: putative DNA binding domain-containing protein [Chloroflexota bacterium]|nr:putative DNA binding domain-containing protein [Chloroflexota bacterium]
MFETDSSSGAMRWYRMDLHLHTPASEDYVQKETSYLEVLQEAERRGLDIIAITDHNTIAGYEAIFDEIEFLEKLRQRGRLRDDEQEELDEYHRLLKQIAVLPGFEFTTRFGAHILGVFPPDDRTSIPQLKAVLHQLGVPYEKMSLGTTSLPGSQAYLEAYKIINQAGGIVIGAHINSPTGVLEIASNMPTGTARVSATQNEYLHALEFSSFHSTQLQGFSSPRWYDGSNLGYERRMHCIQSSDAHRLVQDHDASMHRWGIGDRPTEVLLTEATFDGLLDLFKSNDFNRIRVPFVSDVARYNHIADVRSAGPSDHQILCAGCAENLDDLCCHVAALSNAGGGTIFLGIDPDPEKPVTGLIDAAREMRAFQSAVAERVFPQPEWSVDIVPYEGQEVVQIDVQEAQRKPCYLRDNDERKIYVRQDGATILASHGDIIDLVHAESSSAPGQETRFNGQVKMLSTGVEQPKSGVEVAGVSLRGDREYYRVVDLRTGRESLVSQHTATSVWLYAIKLHQETRGHLADLEHQVRWRDQIGLLRIYRENEVYDQHNRVKCDLVFRNGEGHIERIFHAVAVSWISSAWDALFDFDPPAGIDAEPLPSGRQVRWRGNMGIESLVRTDDGLRGNLVFRNRQGRDLFFQNVPCEKLQPEWQQLLTVPLPRSGLEVVEVFENGTDPLFKFHNLGNQHVESRLWQPDLLKEGSLRHYALRMHLDQDRPIDDSQVSWLGNIGCLRRSFTTTDLVYRDPNGIDHIYYGARWDDLTGEWQELINT